MKKSLFQYAVILHTFDKEGNYLDSEFIIEPKTILAKDQKEVAFKATREIPEDKATNPDNVEILVRNF